VQLSSDGKMVVIHDKTLDRTTDCTGYVKDQTLAYINACNTESAGPHPPSFRQALVYPKATDLKIRAELKGGPGGFTQGSRGDGARTSRGQPGGLCSDAEHRCSGLGCAGCR